MRSEAGFFIEKYVKAENDGSVLGFQNQYEQYF